MKLSFIIPAYNCEKYIKKCINSIIQQTTNLNYEIIIIDDGSTDNTKMEIKKILRKNFKIKYYYQNHQGASIARNYGISKSIGEYMLFVDADDEICDNFFTNIEKEFENNFDVLKTKVDCYDLKKYDKRFELPFFKQLNGYDALIKFCKTKKIFATTWSYIIKREFFLKNKFSFKAKTIHEDYLLIPLVLSKANFVRSVNWYGYKYIKRNDSTTTLSSNENEIKKINDFILNTYSLMKYFYNNKQKNYQEICNYFYERLNIKISHLNLNIKIEMNVKVLSKIERLKNIIQNITDITKLPLEYNLEIEKTVIHAKNIFKSNLISIILGGSCGKGDPIIGWSDIDLYIILKKYTSKSISKFNNIIKESSIHIGITYYSLLEVENSYFDGKTKIMIYEKQNFNVNPTLYGFCYFKKIKYKEIVKNDYNNLPNIIHEFRRMFVNLMNSKNVDKKYIKKLLLLIKCYMNTNGIFLYGYENVIIEFLKIYNKNSTNNYNFDIMNELKCTKNSYKKILNFSEKVLDYVIKNKEEN